MLHQLHLQVTSGNIFIFESLRNWYKIQHWNTKSAQHSTLRFLLSQSFPRMGGLLLWSSEGKDPTLLSDTLHSDRPYCRKRMPWGFRCSCWFGLLVFMHKTSCQGSWQGRIPSVRSTQPTTSLCYLPSQRTGGFGHAGTPAESAPGCSELERRTRHKTVGGDADFVRIAKTFLCLLTVF